MEAQTSGPRKLRGDLQISRQQQGDAVAFVFKDPVSRRFFRCGEAEHFIATQFDGATTWEVIQQRAQEKFGSQVSLDALQQFAVTLERIGLLESPGHEAAAPIQPRRIGGTLLYLRFKAIDPDRFLTRWAPRLRWLFTPGFLFLSASTILAALVITFANGGEIQRDLQSLWRFDALLLAWITILGVTTIHEFAHAFSCKHFGGEVHEMGFMLIYFQPAFYCNVSDAWLFPEKSKRLWVTFAGAYMELFVWALATLLWRLVEPATWPNFVAMVVMATSGIKFIFNMLPLIKLDGYYLLSDLAGIPNLRGRAFEYLAARFRRLCGATEEPVALSRREKWILGTYGALASCYSAWLLWVVGGYFGEALVSRYQGTGFVVFSGLLGMAVGTPASRIFARGRELFSVWKKAHSMSGRQRLILCAGGVLLLLLMIPWQAQVGGEVEVLPAHNADVRAAVDGILEEVLVEEGQSVAAGEPLARLSPRDYRAELSKARAEVAEKHARLLLLEAGPRREEIDLAEKAVRTAKTREAYARLQLGEAQAMREKRLAMARANLAKLQEQVKYAKSELGRAKELFQEGLVARGQLEESEERVNVRENELEATRNELRLVEADDLTLFKKQLAVAAEELAESEARLNTLRAGSRREEIAAMAAEKERSEAQSRYLEGQLERLVVLSAVAGIVTTPKPKERVGEMLTRGDLIMEVHELSTVRAEITVPENDIAQVKIGQPVDVKVRALPNETFKGTVTAIAATAAPIDPTQVWRGRVVRVTTTLANPARQLKPGMTGAAKISCGRRSLLFISTRRLLRFLRVEFWSWW